MCFIRWTPCYFYVQFFMYFLHSIDPVNRYCILTENVVILSAGVHGPVRLDAEMVSPIPAVKFLELILFRIVLVDHRRTECKNLDIHLGHRAECSSGTRCAHEHPLLRQEWISPPSLGATRTQLALPTSVCH